MYLLKEDSVYEEGDSMAIVDEVEAVADISDSSEDSDILDAELVSEDEIGFN